MTEKIKTPMPLLALLLAWILPGAGHWYIGRRLRGVVIGATVAATFWAGVALGGVLTVDAQGERWWFLADMFTGAHGFAAWRYEKRIEKEKILSKLPANQRSELSDPGREQDRQFLLDKLQAEERIALVHPVDNVARAYAGVAGLLNLMCVFDAMILALMGAGLEPKPQPAEAKPS